MVLPAVPWHPLRAPLAWDCAPRRPVATWQFPRDCAERLLVHGVPDDDLLHSARCQPLGCLVSRTSTMAAASGDGASVEKNKTANENLLLGPPCLQLDSLGCQAPDGENTRLPMCGATLMHMCTNRTQEKQSFRAHVFRQHGNTHCNAVGRPTHR